MKITKNQLKQIIKEELTAVLAEENPLSANYPLHPPEMAHTVREGDTLWDLHKAGRFGDFSIEDVIAFNDSQSRAGAPPMDPKNLEIGSKILIPPNDFRRFKAGSLEMDDRALGAQMAKQMGEPRA